MFLPLLLIVVAGLSGGVVAYGSHPNWMRYPHGLEFILWSRRLQWPMVSLSLLACVALMMLAISGRRRAWWLIGLAPVLALFAHRFAGPAAGRLNVAENPVFVSAADAKLGDDEWVVGITFGDESFAYPYATIFSTPVVIQADHEKRMMLLWSAYANRALAVMIDHDLKGHDLEIVSSPANALLVYNSRRGQFINGITGQTDRHEKPFGFSGASPLLTSKMPWKQWRALHPASKVLAQMEPRPANAPAQPIEPLWPMPRVKSQRSSAARVALVGTTEPLAVDSNQLTTTPLNSAADATPVTLFREHPDGPMRAFDRRLFDAKGKLDLIVKLAPNLLPRHHPHAFAIDLGSNTGWTADGVCVDAPPDAKYLKGKRLEPMAVDNDLSWDVIKFWYPQIKIEIAPAESIAVDSETDAADPSKPASSRRRPRKPRSTTPAR